MEIIPQPLRLNIGGYRGKGLDLGSLESGIASLSSLTGWELDRLPCESPVIPALRRKGKAGRMNCYISAGIHGDEPAGPLAVVELISRNRWPEFVNIWTCPFLNPSGLQINRRENILGKDLNRDYRDTKTAEIRAHKQWLNDQPDFDLTLCLHEDWEAQGFYVYELNPDNRRSLAPQIIDSVRAVCPIDGSSQIDGWSAQAGIIRPDKDPFERSEWPEALHLISTKTRQSYTLEAPSDFPIEIRVKALVTAVESAINQLKNAP